MDTDPVNLLYYQPTFKPHICYSVISLAMREYDFKNSIQKGDFMAGESLSLEN